MIRINRWMCMSVAAFLAAAPLPAQGGAPPAGQPGGEGDLAKQLSNPVSSLVSVPFQVNWEFGAGEHDPRTVINFQPVMPFSLSKDWNYIVRVITPVASQPLPDGSTRFGVGDITLETFLAPANAKGLVWGIGPALGLPMGTDPALGAGKWTAGPTAVVLQQTGKWSVGLLVAQFWSYAGDGDRDDVNSTLLQPFVTFGATKTVTLTLNSEANANWQADSGDEWTVPVQLFVSKIVKLGHQPLSVQIGGGWFAEKPDGGPDWRLRSGITLLIPAK